MRLVEVVKADEHLYNLLYVKLSAYSNMEECYVLGVYLLVYSLVFFLKYFKQVKSATILMVRFISRQGLSHVS